MQNMTENPNFKIYNTAKERKKICFFSVLKKSKPSSGTMCPQHSCYSCCDDEKAKTTFSKILNAEGRIIQHGPYKFEGKGKSFRICADVFEIFAL